MVKLTRVFRETVRNGARGQTLFFVVGALEGAMQTEHSLWRAIRWPLLLLAVAALGIAVATVLDRTAAREYALVIGAPALTVLLPVGLVWLVLAAIAYALRRRRRPSSG